MWHKHLGSLNENSFLRESKYSILLRSLCLSADWVIFIKKLKASSEENVHVDAAAAAAAESISERYRRNALWLQMADLPGQTESRQKIKP